MKKTVEVLGLIREKGKEIAGPTLICKLQHFDFLLSPIKGHNEENFEFMTTSDNRSKFRKFMSPKGGFRACFVDATAAVEKMQSLQNSYPLASMAVGRAMIGAGLMAIMLDDEEGRLSVHFQGDGPLGTVFAESNHQGHLRGFCTHPQLQMPYVSGKPLNVSKAIGNGTLAVVRTSKKFAEPQQGMVQIQSGEVAQDLAFFLTASFQIPSALVLGVSVNEYGKVTGAGGIHIEMLPDAEEDSIAQIEKNIKNAPSISEYLESGGDVQQLLNIFFDGFPDIKELEMEAEAEFRCQCNRQRFETSLQLFPLDELKEMQTSGETIDAQCEFCGKRYKIQPEAIGRVIRLKTDQ
ncbi:MAG: hypothetical protein CL677_05930 [Bdellovibrionaceae bacterium]|nr:hypothetical protein [Pseudobdellovibrionaceae bacterium]|tara:strand:+ start:134209 stop:135258 length:1050 start_codon:yes stop_codon:yes gene_type:complete